MHNVALTLNSPRTRTELTRFDWRVETQQDRSNFERVLNGEGRWESVTVPHYGEPLGKAVTYYRVAFSSPDNFSALGSAWLCFRGIDYKAHVFLNGCHLGSHEGFFAPFEFDCTDQLHIGENTLVVKVENDAPQKGCDDTGLYGDKIYAATGPGYDDPQRGWHHCPAGMGIYQPVYLENRSSQHISDVFVRSRREASELEITVGIHNREKIEVPIGVRISILGRNFEEVVCNDQPLEKLNPAGPGINEYKTTVKATNLRDWHPDEPWLYQLQVTLHDEHGNRIDVYERHFGVRSFTMDQAHEPKGRFYLNGKEIRLRGGNTMGHLQQCVIRGDSDQLIEDILLAKLCNMNFLRLTQRPVQREIYDCCDMLGLMLQTDLPFFAAVRRNTFCEGVRQAEEMEKMIRNSPANILISYMNEPSPNAWGKPERYLDRAEMQAFFECADRVVHLQNPDRVIKHVDGDYDPPSDGLPDNHCYNTWYNGHGLSVGKLLKGYWQKIKPGWMYGCGEFGSEGLDPEPLMRRRYPRHWLPHSEQEACEWSPSHIVRAQTGRFHYLWFETRRTVAQWVEASQRHQAWATRVMTEALRRDNRCNSFAIHLFIDAFPSGWMKAIMDCERNAKPAFYAYRQACRPLMLSLRSDRDRFFAGEMMPIEIWVCNDTHEPYPGTKLAYQLRDGDTLLACGRTDARIESMRSCYQGIVELPTSVMTTKPSTLTLEAALLDERGQTLCDSTTALEVWPIDPVRFNERIHVIGSKKGIACRLTKALGVTICDDPTIGCDDVVLIDDLAAYSHREGEVRAAVHNGAQAIFLSLPPGEHTIAGQKITVTPCGMNACDFVNRDTDHRVVEDLKPDSVRMWFDEDQGYVTPFLHNVFEADDWDAILTSGNGDWRGEWRPVLAAAEKIDGKGAWIICQIDLHNRVQTNPIAKLIARRLIEA